MITRGTGSIEGKVKLDALVTCAQKETPEQAERNRVSHLCSIRSSNLEQGAPSVRHGMLPEHNYNCTGCVRCYMV